MKKKTPDFSAFPLLWLAVCFACGIVAGKYFAAADKIWLLFGLTFFCAALLFVQKKIAQLNLARFFAAAAFVCVGAACFQIENQPGGVFRLKQLYDENVIASGTLLSVEGILTRRPEPSADGYFLDIRIEKITYQNTETIVSGNLRLYIPLAGDDQFAAYERLNLDFATRLRAACSPVREDKYLNPGVLSGREMLDRQNLDAAASVKSPALIEKISDESFAPFGWIFRQRETLIREFDRRFTRATAGVLIASLLGDKYFLDKPTAQTFREGGTFHVLIISGLHVTFIGGLILLFVRLFTRRRRWQFVIATSLLWIFTLAVGAEVPVVRAAVMFTILLFARVVYREGSPLNSLGFCALLLLVWKPSDLFGASFQLTFVSVAAIVAFALPLLTLMKKIGAWSPTLDTPFPPDAPPWFKRLCETLYWRESVWELENKRQIWSAKLFKSPYFRRFKADILKSWIVYLFEGAAISLITQICLLPFSVIYFHRLSPSSILLNLWVGFFIALETFAALAAVAVAQLNETASLPLIYLTEILNGILLILPEILIEKDWASFRLPAYAGAGSIIYAVYFLPIGALIYALHRWKPFETAGENKRLRSVRRYALISLPLLIFIITAHPFSPPAADGRLHLDFLDVGQGDAALVTFPNGETLLVDGGGSVSFARRNTGSDDEIFVPDTQNVGEFVVSNFLWHRGYSRLDYILATHADADHIQGLTDAAENFEPRAAFFGRMPADNAEYNRLKKVLMKKGISEMLLSAGDVMMIGGARVEVLNPESDDSPAAVSDNNHGLVLRIVYGEKSFLLVADIEKETEKLLVRNRVQLKANVVKIAHHGSRTSSTSDFVAATQAEYAVVSVGRRSRYGHPHREVLDRWKQFGAEIYVTGERGTISVSTDGNDLNIQTFVR